MTTIQYPIKIHNRQMYAMQVEDVNKIAPDKFLLTLKQKFQFKSGQVIALGIDVEHAPRIYSICSGENDPSVQILFDLKEDGYLTPRMAKMKHGDLIYVSKPYGNFMPVHNQDMWWIASGTGISPFYSMLRSGFQCRAKLLHGARENQLFYFQNEFKDALGKNYIQCCSQEHIATGFNGRVNKYIEQQAELPLDALYYLCGRALMVVEVRDLLIAKGVPYENIISEIFF